MLSGNAVKTLRCPFDALHDPLRLTTLSGNGALSCFRVSNISAPTGSARIIWSSFSTPSGHQVRISEVSKLIKLSFQKSLWRLKRVNIAIKCCVFLVFRGLEQQSLRRPVPGHLPPAHGPMWCHTEHFRECGTTGWDRVSVGCRDVLSLWNGRAWGALRECVCVDWGPQLLANPLWWPSGKRTGLHCRVCGAAGFEKAVLWWVPC